MSWELAALGAAFSWVFASLLAADTSREIGGMAFNRLRICAAFLILLVITGLSGELSAVPLHWYPVLALSGVIGLAVGDTALFAAFRLLGPRRAQVLYASNAPMAVVLGILFLGESLSLLQTLGIIAVFAGVVTAIVWGKRPSQLHRWEQVQGALWVGVSLGLLAGFGQALGSLIVKPVLDAGVDPMAASTIRIGAAALVLLLLQRTRFGESGVSPVRVRHVITAALNATIAIVIGVSLLLYAFAHGSVGISAILSATTPVLILPILWLRTGERPALGAWCGAIIAVTGTAVILSY